MIKTFEPEDWPHFISLVRALYAESTFSGDLVLNERGVLEALKKEGMWGVLAYNENEEAIGMCFAYVEKPYFSSDLIATQHYFYILPAFRGNGVAKELFGAFEMWARDQGVSECWVSQATGIEVDRTREVFEHFGYQTVGFIGRKVV
jgi:GNAT superfamily N-acetyltransferase